MLQYLAMAGITAFMSYLIYLVEAHPRKPMQIDYFENAFKRYEEGAFSLKPPFTTDPTEYMLITFLLLFAPLIWVLFNVPDAFRPALLYVVLALFMVPVCLLEYMFPLKFKAAGLVGWGGEEYTEQIMVGLGIGVATVIMFAIVGEYQSGQTPSKIISGPFLISAFFTLAIAPFIEEWFFGNLLPASLMEEIGWVGGTIISAISFSLMHYLAYSASLPLMAVVFCFRVMACIAMLKWVSFLPGMAAHTFVNFVAFISAAPG